MGANLFLPRGGTRLVNEFVHRLAGPNEAELLPGNLLDREGVVLEILNPLPELLILLLVKGDFLGSVLDFVLQGVYLDEASSAKQCEQDDEGRADGGQGEDQLRPLKRSFRLACLPSLCSAFHARLAFASGGTPAPAAELGYHTPKHVRTTLPGGPPSSAFQVRSGDIVKHPPPLVKGNLCEALFNPQQLIVLRHPVRPAHRTGLYLACIRGHGDIGNGWILRLS